MKLFSALFIATPLMMSGSEKPQGTESISERIIYAYLQECMKDTMVNTPVSFRFEKTATCGSVCSRILPMRVDEHIDEAAQDVAIETTIIGWFNELESPNDTLSEMEKSHVGGDLLLDIEKHGYNKEGTVKLDEHTECKQPVFYNAYRGWIRCTTWIQMKELKKLRDALRSQNDEPTL